MKKQAFLFLLALSASPLWAQEASVSGPDQQLRVNVSVENGAPLYSVTYKGKTILEPSPLGFVANIGDFSQGMTYVEQKKRTIGSSAMVSPSRAYSESATTAGLWSARPVWIPATAPRA